MSLTPPLKILIVDDNDDLRDQLAMACESLGHQAAGAATAQSALQQLASPEERPDVMLTDVRMPDMDGISLLRELRRRGIDLPVIVISGHADQDLSNEVLRLGAVAFLDKPFGLAGIRDCLDSVLQPAAPDQQP